MKRRESAEDDHATPTEIPIGQRAEIDERIRDAHFAPDQTAKADGEEDSQRLHAEEGIAKPIPFLAFTQRDFPSHHREAQQAEAERVEPSALLARVELGGLQEAALRLVRPE